jgi:hypothetical protein
MKKPEAKNCPFKRRAMIAGQTSPPLEYSICPKKLTERRVSDDVHIFYFICYACLVVKTFRLILNIFQSIITFHSLSKIYIFTR